jgi:hypothetical protein
MGRARMGNNNVYVNLPYNEQFEYVDFQDYLKSILGPTSVIEDDVSNMRLPGNTDIFTFLLYCGKLFKSWYLSTFPNINIICPDCEGTGIRNADGTNIQCGFCLGSGKEIPQFSPDYPDRIYSLLRGGDRTADSPHVKIPPVVSFTIKRKEPASMTGGKMFGSGKHWKFRVCGDVKGTDGNIYRLRSRFWESLVEFTIIHRSGLEVENLCTIFEKFMDLNEGKFLEAGLSKMIPRGRMEQTDPTLANANVRYRRTYFYFRTQEFQFAGPITPITEVEITAVPT